MSDKRMHYEVREPGDGEYKYFIVPPIQQDEHNGEYDNTILAEAIEAAKEDKQRWVVQVTIEEQRMNME